MNKIPSVFMRNPDNMRELTKTPHPDALWVIAGEGIPTRKYDGTCVMLDEDGRWWARREVKAGKVPPPNWKPVEKDDFTGKIMGWEPIEQSGWRRFHQRATAFKDFTPGTYELCGPNINGNPEKLEEDTLFKHGEGEVWPYTQTEPYTYEELRDLVLYVQKHHGWEGIVWHHPDGRMAKLKGRDFIGQ